VNVRIYSGRLRIMTNLFLSTFSFKVNVRHHSTQLFARCLCNIVLGLFFQELKQNEKKEKERKKGWMRHTTWRTTANAFVKSSNQNQSRQLTIT